MTRRLRLVVGLLAAGAGCAGEPAPCGLRNCDIRDPACQRLVAEGTACMRQVAPVMVPVTVVRREEFLRDETQVTLSPEEETAFRYWHEGLELFGLAPANLSPAQEAEAYTTQFGAFYSSIDKAITIIADDDRSPLDSIYAVALLAHEFTHALQDASFDLVAVHERATDRDRDLAVRGVIEGEATYIGDLVKVGLFGDRPADIPWQTVYQNWQTRARGEALASDLPVTLAPWHFPYPFGTELLHDVIGQGGWSAAAALFSSPPSGTREVLAGFGAPEPAAGPWAEDLGADSVPVLPDRFALQAAERMGAWIGGLLFERAKLAFADDAAAGMTGDVLSIFHDQIAAAPVAVWRFRFTSADLAATVAAAPAFGVSGRVRRLDRDVVFVSARDAGSLFEIPADLSFQPVPAASAASPKMRGTSADIP